MIAAIFNHNTDLYITWFLNFKILTIFEVKTYMFWLARKMFYENILLTVYLINVSVSSTWAQSLLQSPLCSFIAIPILNKADKNATK